MVPPTFQRCKNVTLEASEIRMNKSCEFCDREVVKKLPENAFTVKCGGKECGHCTVYGLIDEDCRQVIFDDGE